MTQFAGAIGVDISHDSKTGIVAATHVAQQSCPPDCPLRNAGCYGEGGRQAMHTARLNREDRTALECARDEVRAINHLTSGLPLRLHVVGDCSTKTAARMVSNAAARYLARTKAPAAWTYTHAWRKVPRAAWHHKVSVLASCDGIDDVKGARAQGYKACAVVVAKHADGKAYNVEGVGKVVPCPNQIDDSIKCSACRLCWQERDITIAFEAHGNRAGMIRERLRVLQ